MITDGRQDGGGMGRRLAALVGAAALIIVAFVVRGGLGDDDDNGSSEPATARRLVCSPDLVGVCRDVAGDDMTVIEQAASETTAALLAPDATPGADGDLWLTSRSWAEAVSGLAAPGGVSHLADYLDTQQEALARTPVVVMAWEDRADALEAGECSGGLAWLCIGDAADRDWGDVGGDPSWGRVQAGLVDSASFAAPAVWGNAAAAYLEDAGYHTNDIDHDLVRWFDGFTAAVGSDPVRDMLTRGRGHLAVLGTTEAAAMSAVGRDDVRIEVSVPVSTVDLVLVPLTEEATGDAERLAADGDLAEGLARAGWRVPGQDPAPGLDPDFALPEEPGLPAGVVLHALLSRLS